MWFRGILNLQTISFKKKYSNSQMDTALPFLMEVTEGTTYCIWSNITSHLLSVMEKEKKKDKEAKENEKEVSVLTYRYINISIQTSAKLFYNDIHVINVAQPQEAYMIIMREFQKQDTAI